MIPELLPEIADYAAAELPRKLQVELTSKCPFDCIFCSRRMLRGAGQDLDFSVYKSLIKELQDPEIIRLDYSGESIHYPHLIQAIELAHSTGAATELITAFSTASALTIHELVRSGLDRLTISLHTMQQDQFQEIYRFSSLPDMRSKLAMLVEARRNFGSSTPRLDFAFVAMKENLAELPSVASYARALGIDEVSVLPLILRDPVPAELREELAGGRLENSFKADLNQAVLLARHMAKGVPIRIQSPECEPERHLGSIPQSYPEPLPPGTMISSCEQNPWETVHVLADGSIVACEVQDRTVLGNLHRESLREIWHGDAYRDLRRRYLAGEIAECASCSWKTAFVSAPLKPQVLASTAGLQLFRGWHDLDDSGTLWSKKDAVILLASEGNPSKVRLVGALPPSTDSVENSVRLTCNGTFLGSAANPTNALIDFDTCFGGLPRGSDPLVFTLTVQKSYKPALASIKGDFRSVGMALYCLELVE